MAFGVINDFIHLPVHADELAEGQAIRIVGPEQRLQHAFTVATPCRIFQIGPRRVAAVGRWSGALSFGGLRTLRQRQRGADE